MESYLKNRSFREPFFQEEKWSSGFNPHRSLEPEMTPAIVHLAHSTLKEPGTQRSAVQETRLGEQMLPLPERVRSPLADHVYTSLRPLPVPQPLSPQPLYNYSLPMLSLRR